MPHAARSQPDQPAPSTGRLICADLGRRPYLPVLGMQEELAARVAAGEPERLLLVEHDPPAITLGRRGGPEQVLASPEQLVARGVELHRVRRGGGATYHGPGQLVAYPILRLNARRNLRALQGGLEEVVLRLLAEAGVTGERIDGLTGVWVGGRKIAAIGIAASRWVSTHGVALNVSIDTGGFDLIVPCGIADRGVTSMSAEGASLPMSAVKRRFARLFSEVFGLDADGPGVDGAPPRTDRRRLPRWMRRPISPAGRAPRVRRLLDEGGLHTVCSGASCPNRAECFSRGTATFMILGAVCTRACRFCAVPHGRPGPVRPDEPHAVARAAAAMGLRHVVVTSVTRDDLPDGGAGHFARTIRAVRERLPDAGVEVLVPDFLGRRDAIDAVLDAGPDVFNHNLETVERLSADVRPQADYRRSLDVLAQAARRARRGGRCRHVKSGLMLGLGETDAELRAALGDLRRAGCSLLTLGQYLSPSPDRAGDPGPGASGSAASTPHRPLPVARFVRPEQFDHWRLTAMGMGFAAVAAGPFVRSSYRAEVLAGR